MRDQAAKKRWRANPENRAREQAAAIKYYHENKEKLLARKNARIAANPEIAARWGLSSHLRRRYNMTIEQYETMLESQGNVCAICESPETGRKDCRWSVDHCHSTNVVRGILCHHCNAVLGYAKDNVKTLIRASQYLSQLDAGESQ